MPLIGRYVHVYLFIKNLCGKSVCIHVEVLFVCSCNMKDIHVSLHACIETNAALELLDQLAAYGEHGVMAEWLTVSLIYR